MFQFIGNACKSAINFVVQKLKQLIKPTTFQLVADAVSDMTRSRKDLMVENAFLRQQLIVLNRQVKRPKLTEGDRTRMVFLSSLTNFWQSALHIVRPDTLVRWHRGLFRRYGKRISTPKSRKPRIPQATIDLIKKMARETTMGAEKIHGALLELGIKVSKRTIQKYIRMVRKKSGGGQSWETFLRNHAKEIWACDFTTIHTLFFKPLYLLVFMKHETREIVHTAVTAHPTDEWAAQQLKEATPWDQRPKYLIHDNDGKFGAQFAAAADSSSIEIKQMPPRAPKANAHCERLIGSIKRECLDYFIILNERHLKHIVNKFTTYYNERRNHQGINQKIPYRFQVKRPLPSSNEVKGQVVSTPMLNGLHHYYTYAAAA